MNHTKKALMKDIFNCSIGIQCYTVWEITQEVILIISRYKTEYMNSGPHRVKANQLQIFHVRVKV